MKKQKSTTFLFIHKISSLYASLWTGKIWSFWCNKHLIECVAAYFEIENKLKSLKGREMKDEWRMMKDEGWMMKDDDI